MASKVPNLKPRPQAEESKALTTVAPTQVMSLLPTTGVTDGLEAPDSGSFFPQLKMVFPVEIRPQGPYKQAHSYTVGLSNSESYEPLEEGYILALLDCRNASRQQTTNEDDDTTYIRAYDALNRGGKVYGKTVELYREQHKAAISKEDGYFAGVSLVVAVIRADGSVALAEMPLFKTQRAYWQNHVTKTSVTQGIGMCVKIANHFDNVIESKNGKTSYPGPKKFNQFDFVQLTEDQIRAIGAALEDSANSYMSWLER